MLGPFATARRRTLPVLILHCHSPGVATVDTTTKMSRSQLSLQRRRRATVATPGEWQCKIDVHNDNANNNDNAWHRGPLWPHRMGPITSRQLQTRPPTKRNHDDSYLWRHWLILDEVTACWSRGRIVVLLTHKNTQQHFIIIIIIIILFVQ